MVAAVTMIAGIGLFGAFTALVASRLVSTGNETHENKELQRMEALMARLEALEARLEIKRAERDD
jgi:hypothetical protein